MSSFADSNIEHSVNYEDLYTRKLPVIEIIIAQQTVLLPLYFFIPNWIIVLNSVCAALVIMGHSKSEFRVPQYLKLSITILAIGGILITFHKFSGRDAGVSLISVMYGLKILELYRKRDAHIMLGMGFFLMVSGFLFTQSPVIAIYQVVPLIALLNGFMKLVIVNRSQLSAYSLLDTIRNFSKYLVVAIPIMIVLFIFFPRLSGPLWRMPHSGSAVSGVSDSMSPGEISSLHLSDEVAFRVKFHHQEPLANELYWRLMVLDDFDGISWTRKGVQRIDDPSVAVLNDGESQEKNIAYTVTLEPTKQHFIPTLEFAYTSPSRSRLLEDYATYYYRPVFDRVQYTAIASVSNILKQDLSNEHKTRYTTLPNDNNERARQWALELKNQLSTDRAYIEYLLSYINQEPYFYTLTPPIMDEDMIDSFWFDHKTGFCEHFASGLVYMARAANIPARVVVGYQGGEKNSLSDYWIVRYSDAHAWTEVWLQGTGWVRVDPTSAIDPGRVDLSALENFRQRDSLFEEFDFSRLNNESLTKTIGFWIDELNNQWNTWVIDYNQSRQNNFIKNLGLESLSSSRLFLIATVVVLSFILLSTIKVYRKRKVVALEAKVFDKLIKFLVNKQIITYSESDGPHSILNKLNTLESQESDVSRIELIRIGKSVLLEYIKIRYEDKIIPLDVKESRAFYNRSMKMLKLY